MHNVPNSCPRCKAVSDQNPDTQVSLRWGREQKMICGICRLVYAIHLKPGEEFHHEGHEGE